MRDQIPALLEKNIFLSPEVKKRIEDDYLSLDEVAVGKVIELLNKALDKQKILIERALTKDPNLLSRAKHEVSNALRQEMASREAEERKGEEIELNSLEEELNALFD